MMRRIMGLCLGGLLSGAAFANPPAQGKVNTPVVQIQNPSAPAPTGIQAPEVSAKQVYLFDLNTRTVLWEKDAHIPVPPSSMTKMMTVYMAFDYLKKGRARMDDLVTISKKAWQMEGSRMFVNVGAQVPVKDLLYGIIVQSGNDASVALAEHLAGTEVAFAEMMTAKARELGATNTTFLNVSGLPDDNHRSTMADLAVIAEKTINDFPDLYPIYKETSFTHNDITQPNRNPLLGTFGGCDGLKTGSTDAGGYGVTASAVQNGRRLILVINGCTSMKDRAKDSEALMTWGFKSFASPILARKGQVLEEAPVWLGSAGSVPVEVGEKIAVTVPRTQLYNIKVDVAYDAPIPAPIQKGQKVGSLVVTIPGRAPQAYPLVAGADVGRANVFSRIGSAFNYLVFGNNS